MSFALPTAVWVTNWIGQFFALTMGALPIVVRAALHQPPLGTGPLQIILTLLMFYWRGFGSRALSTFLFASVWDYIRRAWMLRVLGCLIRAPMRDAHTPIAQEDQHGADSRKRAEKRRLDRARTFVSHDREEVKDLPLLDMHCRDTIKGWLQARLVVTSFAERYRIRIQMYFSVLLILTASDIIWQLAAHSRELSAPGTAPLRLGLGAYVCILITIPSVIALTLMLAAGAFVNERHCVHRDFLLTHRLLLREWAMDLGAEAANGKRWAIDEDCDDLLRTAGEFVAATPPLRVFGFGETHSAAQLPPSDSHVRLIVHELRVRALFAEASSALLKGFVSVLVSAVILVAGLLSSSGRNSAAAVSAAAPGVAT